MDVYDRETEDFLINEFQDEEDYSTVTEGSIEKPDPVAYTDSYGLNGGVEVNNTVQVPDLLLNLPAASDEVPSFTVKEEPDCNAWVGQLSDGDCYTDSSSNTNSCSITTTPEPNEMDITVSNTISLVDDNNLNSLKTDQEKRKKDRIRASVAKASRKIRLKRKLERENLLKRNQELEDEQEDFLKRIGELQYQVNCMKTSPYGTLGNIDLKSENILLSAQVNRHRNFVKRIKCIIQEGNNLGPNLSNIEKIKIANNGIESGVGHLLGMCYTSVMDSTWKTLEYIPKQDVLKHLPFKGSKAVVRYQFLPIGSSPETASRVNIRVDNSDIPAQFLRLAIRTQLGNFSQKQLNVKAMSNKLQKEPGMNINKVELEELDIGFSTLSLNNKNTTPVKNNGEKNGNENVENEKITDEMKAVEQQQQKEEPELIAPFSLKKICINGKENRFVFHSNVKRTINPLGFPDVTSVSSSGDTPKQLEATVVIRTEAPVSLVNPSLDANYFPEVNVGEIDGYVFHEMDAGAETGCFTRVTSRSLDPQTPFLRLAQSKMISIMKDTSLNESEKISAVLDFNCRCLERAHTYGIND